MDSEVVHQTIIDPYQGTHSSGASWTIYNAFFWNLYSPMISTTVTALFCSLPRLHCPHSNLYNAGVMSHPLHKQNQHHYLINVRVTDCRERIKPSSSSVISPWQLFTRSKHLTVFAIPDIFHSDQLYNHQIQCSWFYIYNNCFCKTPPTWRKSKCILSIR